MNTQRRYMAYSLLVIVKKPHFPRIHNSITFSTDCMKKPRYPQINHDNKILIPLIAGKIFSCLSY